MKKILNPSCSEAVFKFYTTEPADIQEILQAIKNEVDSNYSESDVPDEQIPLWKDAKMYDTGWNGEKEYSGGVADEFRREERDIEMRVEKGELNANVAAHMIAELNRRKTKKIYPNSLMNACAGLGDNDAVVTVNDDCFTLNIGNNDISENKTGWIEKITDMGIKVEEAEYSKELQKIARDCTCGITYFDGYENLIKDEVAEEEDA